MDVTQIITLADTGMHDGIGAGWVAVMAVFMVAMMGVMMYGMSRMMGGGSEETSSDPSDRESALEVLERRFAAGEISAEEYRERREVLVNGNSEANGHREEATLTGSGPREGRQ